MSNNEGIPLHGDRGAWNTVDHADEHAKDIQDDALLRHLPAPSADGNFVRDDGSNWQSQAGIDLVDLNDYARGMIIRGGIADWEAYGAATLGYVLIGDGTDVVSRALVLDDMDDVNAPSPNDEDVLTWDNVAEEWIAAPSSGGALELDDLTDVDLTTTPPVDGDVLVYDEYDQIWYPAEQTGSGTALTVKETDGSPSVNDVGIINLPSGMLQDNGDGEVTLLVGSLAQDHEHTTEDLSSQCNGATVNFSTSNVFEGGSTVVSLNGLVLREGSGYSYTEDVDLEGITFATAPLENDELIVSYRQSGIVSIPTSLADLDDVDLSYPAEDGDVLVYDAYEGLWYPAEQSGTGGGADILEVQVFS